MTATVYTYAPICWNTAALYPDRICAVAGLSVPHVPRMAVPAVDLWRFRETEKDEDMYAFRTPPLRNVALTAPYGHAGAYDSLEDVVRHHLDPQSALWEYHENDDCRIKPVMPSRADLDDIDCIVMDDPTRVQAIAKAAEGYSPVYLDDREIEELLAFLHALTDKSDIDLRSDVPAAVPSGLTLAE